MNIISNENIVINLKNHITSLQMSLNKSIKLYSTNRLTAFVLRTFGKAQRYIFIDPQKIENSKQWLIRHQRPDGLYESRGKLFNNRMKVKIFYKVYYKYLYKSVNLISFPLKISTLIT